MYKYSATSLSAMQTSMCGYSCNPAVYSKILLRLLSDSFTFCFSYDNKHLSGWMLHVMDNSC
jgi:hypothetical protein